MERLLLIDNFFRKLLESAQPTISSTAPATIIVTSKQ